MRNAMYRSTNPMTVSCPLPSPANDSHDAPVARAETRYATGMRAAARRSGLLGKRSVELLNELSIHARKPTVITSRPNRTLECATLTQGRGTKKNGVRRKRRYTDHRATVSAWARYCIVRFRKLYHGQKDPLRGLFAASILATLVLLVWLKSKRAKLF